MATLGQWGFRYFLVNWSTAKIYWVKTLYMNCMIHT